MQHFPHVLLLGTLPPNSSGNWLATEDIENTAQDSVSSRGSIG